MAISEPLISERFPYLPVNIEAAGVRWTGDALVDTGFEGDVILPANIRPGVPEEVSLPWRLADGSLAMAPGYRGTLRLGASTLHVVVSLLGSEPILGINVVREFVITFERGQRLIVH